MTTAADAAVDAQAQYHFTVLLLQKAESELARLRAVVNAVEKIHNRTHVQHLFNGSLRVCNACQMPAPCPTFVALYPGESS